LPTRTPQPTATVVVTGMRIEITGSRANLRTGPGTNYPISDVVTVGAVLRLIGRTSDGFWYHVRTADGRTAWVGSTVAEVSGGVTTSRVPVVATVVAPAPPNRAPAPVNPNPAPSSPTAGCCKICDKGKACGNTCIRRSYTCHQPPGCACNAGLMPPVVAFGLADELAWLYDSGPVRFWCNAG
jgi:hypothetical protein